MRRCSPGVKDDLLVESPLAIRAILSTRLRGPEHKPPRARSHVVVISGIPQLIRLALTEWRFILFSLMHNMLLCRWLPASNVILKELRKQFVER